ncbi:prenyltransferase [Halomonas vilamensis]|uniref:Prenyltransferase n=1 Tax=Vreelandella vilamensis TaxID=531309 RepID=A0ABU1H1K2_9GAMM|nr:prenyltransferase [Halomonas vilamensis]MDR5898178.1 prenyltransferase [Halomonas vilamensis]
MHFRPLIAASRPGFLMLAVLCVGLAVALVQHQSMAVTPLHGVLILLAALLAHIAVNLMNEYDDFHSGLDVITQRTPFSGGSGALPAQPAAALQVLWGALVALGLVVCIGLYFVWLRGGALLLLGISGVLLVMGYTRWLTRSPLLCLFAPGLGFAIVVVGSVLALGGKLTDTVWAVTLVVLLLVNELLLLNQFPDVEADRQVGRRHLLIVFGREMGARTVVVLWLVAYLVMGISIWQSVLPALSAIALLPFPVVAGLSVKLNAAAASTTVAWPPLLMANVAALLGTLALLIVGLCLG